MSSIYSSAVQLTDAYSRLNRIAEVRKIYDENNKKK